MPEAGRIEDEFVGQIARELHTAGPCKHSNFFMTLREVIGRVLPARPFHGTLRLIPPSIYVLPTSITTLQRLLRPTRLDGIRTAHRRCRHS